MRKLDKKNVVITNEMGIISQIIMFFNGQKPET